ncbi:MAG: hypothetical protein WEA56_13200 [Balneolaceae bacterium]
MRWLLFAIFIYVIYKLIQGPKRRAGNRNFRFGPFSGDGNKTSGRIDHIEEAEFEDITDKEKKTD